MNSFIARRHWPTAVLTLGIILSMGAAAQLFAASGNSQDKPAAPKAHAQPLSGERIFMTNCHRCHMPPMSLPPRITGTIIMHMRVRARLSKEEQEALMKYLAP